MIYIRIQKNMFNVRMFYCLVIINNNCIFLLFKWSKTRDTQHSIINNDRNRVGMKYTNQLRPNVGPGPQSSD